MAIVRSQSKHLKGLPPGKAAVVTAGGIRYVERGDYVPEGSQTQGSQTQGSQTQGSQTQGSQTQEPPPPAKPKRAPRQPAARHDPKQLAAARELRDRFLEMVNHQRFLPHGKYDVSRALASDAAPNCTIRQLSSAA
jgi:hypothetical protein